MDNKGPDTNNSKFIIHFNKDHELDQKNTVFGRIIHNYPMMSKMETSQCTARNPVPPRCVIVDCGELLGDQKLTEKDNLKQYPEIIPEPAPKEPEATKEESKVNADPEIEEINDDEQD